MFATKRYWYGIMVVFFLTAFLSFQVWAEGKLKKTSSKEQKTQNQQTQAPSKDQPRMTFDTPQFDAGKVWEGGEVSHTFTVKNTGTATLEIMGVRPG